MPSGPALDHVVLGVPDLDAAAQVLADLHGLTALPGGRHQGWGTHNRVVPLGDTYLELVAVADPGEAAVSGFGRWVGAMAAGTSPPGWVVRTDDLDATADRLGLQVHSGSRRRADGSMLTWRLAGIDDAAQDPGLPFFIRWGPHADLPGRTPVQHPAGAVTLSRLQVHTDPGRLYRWLDDHVDGVDVSPGAAGVASVELTDGSGVRVLDPAALRG